MRISDWSSDVCSSDLTTRIEQYTVGNIDGGLDWASIVQSTEAFAFKVDHDFTCIFTMGSAGKPALARPAIDNSGRAKARSEEHTSELQSLMRTSYAVFCLKKKPRTITPNSARTYVQIPPYSQPLITSHTQYTARIR